MRHTSGEMVPMVLAAITLSDGLAVPPCYVPCPSITDERRAALGITPWTSIEASVALEAVRRRALQPLASLTEDRPAVRRGLSKSPGEALHRACGVAGVGDHYVFASTALGRRVTSFRSLSADDIRRVRAALPALAEATR